MSFVTESTVGLAVVGTREGNLVEGETVVALREGRRVFGTEGVDVTVGIKLVGNAVEDKEGLLLLTILEMEGNMLFDGDTDGIFVDLKEGFIDEGFVVGRLDGTTEFLPLVGSTEGKLDKENVGQLLLGFSDGLLVGRTLDFAIGSFVGLHEGNAVTFLVGTNVNFD